MGRIGFCCKYVAAHSKKVFESVDFLNTGSTTVAWLRRQNKTTAEQKIWDLMVKNLTATQKLVETVANLDINLRMLRIGSDLLPMYTHPDFKYFWKQSDVKYFTETQFGEIGRIARELDVRLSFHPGPIYMFGQ